MVHPSWFTGEGMRALGVAGWRAVFGHGFKLHCSNPPHVLQDLRDYAALWLDLQW